MPYAAAYACACARVQQLICCESEELTDSGPERTRGSPASDDESSLSGSSLCICITEHSEQCMICKIHSVPYSVHF